MALAVGDLCTVVYSSGGFRYALPVEPASLGQTVYLSDFGVSGVGTPLRIRSVAEIAATVPDDPDHPRVNRVVGTIAYDGNTLPLFVPLGVMPVPEERQGTSIVFVVLADTSPIGQPSFGFRGFFTRKAGEFDIIIRRGLNVRDNASAQSFENVWYVNNAVTIANVGYARFIQTINATPITTRTDQVGDVVNGVPLNPPVTTFNTANVAIGSSTPFVQSNGVISTLSASYILTDFSFFTGRPDTTYSSGRTFQADYEYFPVAMQTLRTNLGQWSELPSALVYHLPLSTDAIPGTPDEILPTGVTDTQPLTIISEGFPTAESIVPRIVSAAGGDGLREVRFFTALSTTTQAARVQSLIAEVIGALNASGAVVATTTPAPNNDWLKALSDSAAQLPDA